MTEQTTKMRYRMSSRDAYYGGGLVNGARSVTLMGDTAKRLMGKTFGNIGRCFHADKVRFFEPIYAGDYMEFIARIRAVEGKKVTIETRAFKIAVVPENPPFESSLDVLENPVMTAAMLMQFELPE